MAIHRVTKRGHVAGERHTGSHVAPQTASTVYTHLGLCDVRGHTEVGDPKILREEGGREGGREGGMEGERDGGREGGMEGGREGGKEGRREGEKRDKEGAR